MITGTIKNKVDKIWTDIWAGGLTNPLTVIEQLTYLLFIRSLDEKELDNERMDALMGTKGKRIFPSSPIGQSMRWSQFKDIKEMKGGRLPDFDTEGNVIVGESIDSPTEDSTAFSQYMQTANFLIPTPQVLEKIVTGLEDLYTNDIESNDMQGDLYEYMLGKLSTAGQNGQFRTPKHIREMMVKIIAPQPGELLCENCTTSLIRVAAA